MAATANVKTIFAQALELESEAQRQAYLQQACQDRPEVRAEVEDLLRNLELAEAFMQTPVPADPPTLDYLAPAESTGTTIGPYRLLDKLGEGGFGVVYRAEQQEPLHREVALKIIRPGMGSKDVVARFEAERQTLALMDHTNIARALDAGTTESGSPYFVMELVHGEPITRYCDRHRLSITRRLELFVSVCQAVQHAHHKGIIHRDIKPSNVLVTCEDGEPVVKMIDFGVAKAVRQGPLEATVSVTLGMVGTPLYMSPEQSGGNSVDVDTRSDIYSLGVLLYELLTGSTPLDGKRLSQAGYNELRQAILEDEPVRPSVKVSASTPAEVCAQRQVDARRLSALLRGDLDWIVLKALEKEPARRYASAKDFADDVVRHLADEPVEASPPSTLYQLRKLVRRHRVTISLVAAALLLVGSLGLGLGVAAFASLEARASKAETQIARQAREKERQARERAEQKARDEKWLRAKVKPELAQLTENRNYSEAFSLAKLALAKFPADAAVLRTWYEVSATWTVITDPPGARVSVRPYGSDKPFRPLGTTPLHRVPVARGVYSWTIEADDYAPMEGCAGPEAVELKRDLDKAGTVPEGMVRVAGSVSTEEMISLEEEVSFFIDRHEVTNREFKRFVDAGGYQKKQYWEHSFRDGEKTLTFAEAMKRFVDTTTKQPGPATWKNGTYPPGEDDYPVRGVSWYEAAAYAAWLADVTGLEKALPPLAYRQVPEPWAPAVASGRMAPVTWPATSGNGAGMPATWGKGTSTAAPGMTRSITSTAECVNQAWTAMRGMASAVPSIQRPRRESWKPEFPGHRFRCLSRSRTRCLT
jgi:serine/threonine protein kinase